jgi:hypothetical protein
VSCFYFLFDSKMAFKLAAEKEKLTQAGKVKAEAAEGRLKEMAKVLSKP